MDAGFSHLVRHCTSEGPCWGGLGAGIGLTEANPIKR
jgi:hypothetical protein